jgi:eukaryotic-like serine/threonine-protein kinase
MKPERWNQIEGLFLQAVELPQQDRERFLAEVCKGDETLRQELNSLLACDTPETPLVSGSFLPPGDALDDTTSDATADSVGRRIGPYRLLRLLGRGGMGSVHLAVRDDDHYHKEVAIKLLKRGMDTDLMLRRFRQERQILANLEHPFIARLLDGGATDDGLPYFVMEYIDGAPITTYCAEHNLDLTNRLRLFRLVCEAVQYAHQHLVIHRDLKPGNILITKERIPKLLDFGIAKLMDPERGVELRTLTGVGQRMLTPDYASPEQFLGQTISTSSDIYSLGAVLYELLTGQRPHRFEADSLAGMEKAICEVEPDKPSTAVVRGSQDPPRLRQQRRRQLSGDLDNIILTALRKEPQRRYTSAAELSEDLHRHLEGLPVTARDDRLTYRMGKFIRRHKLGVIAVLLVITSLAAGIVATTYQARRAERRFQHARQLAKAVLADVKGPMWRLPGSTALRASMLQTVVRYLDGLAEDSGGDPTFDLEIASAYREVAYLEGSPHQQNLGQSAAALEHYQKAITIYARMYTSFANRAAIKVHALGGLIGANIEAGQIEARTGKPGVAEARLKRMVALAADATARDSGALLPGTWAYLYFRLGGAEMGAGAPEQALVHYRKALEVCMRWAATDRGANARGTLRGAYTNVAGAQLKAGDLYGARENYLTALRVVEEATRQSDATVYERSTLSAAHQNLGDLLAHPYDFNFGDRPGAISHYRLAIKIVKDLAATDLHDVRARVELASAYRNFGAILLEERPAESLKLYQEATAISEKLSVGDPSNTEYRYDFACGQMGIGESLHKLGKNREALQKLTTGLETMKSLAGAEHDALSLADAVARIHRDIGNVLLTGDDEKGALEHYLAGLAITEEFLRRAPANLYFQRYRADTQEALGRYYLALAARRPELRVEARTWFQKSLALWQGWTARNLAIPYAARRQRQATAYLASSDQP